jgi:hypothetical protein
LVIVSGAKSILPETASAIYELAKKGVKFLFVDQLPSETPSYYEKQKGDQQVQSLMSKASALGNVLLHDAPKDERAVTDWAENVKNTFSLQSNISIDNIHEKLYVLKHQSASGEIFFLSNQDEEKQQTFKAIFTSTQKTPWCWDAQTGERFIIPTDQPGVIDISLQALESMLIVLEDNNGGEISDQRYPDEQLAFAISNKWKLNFKPFKGEAFEISTNNLFEFGTHDDKLIATFAGQVFYETTIELKDTEWAFLDLGIEKQVSEVIINDVELGVRWWGRHLYAIPENILRKGENKVQIKYTTTLANYANSLTENSAAKRWINLKEPEVMGLHFEVKFIKSNS